VAQHVEPGMRSILADRLHDQQPPDQVKHGQGVVLSLRLRAAPVRGA
jgi:hypothetical protein